MIHETHSIDYRLLYTLQTNVHYTDYCTLYRQLYTEQTTVHCIDYYTLYRLLYTLHTTVAYTVQTTVHCTDYCTLNSLIPRQCCPFCFKLKIMDVIYLTIQVWLVTGYLTREGFNKYICQTPKSSH